MYVRMHLSYFVPIVTFHLPWGACCTGWNDEESRNGGKSAQADDRDDKGHQTLVGVVCKRQGDEMQQKWVEKLGRGNRYICWSVVSTRVAMSHELGGEGGSVGIRQFGRVMRTGFRALSQVFSSFGWVGVPRRSTSMRHWYGFPSQNRSRS